MNEPIFLEYLLRPEPGKKSHPIVLLAIYLSTGLLLIGLQAVAWSIPSYFAWINYLEYLHAGWLPLWLVFRRYPRRSLPFLVGVMAVIFQIPIHSILIELAAGGRNRFMSQVLMISWYEWQIGGAVLLSLTASSVFLWTMTRLEIAALRIGSSVPLDKSRPYSILDLLEMAGLVALLVTVMKWITQSPQGVGIFSLGLSASLVFSAAIMILPAFAIGLATTGGPGLRWLGLLIGVLWLLAEFGERFFIDYVMKQSTAAVFPSNPWESLTIYLLTNFCFHAIAIIVIRACGYRFQSSVHGRRPG